jgi:hypothetical protein
LSFYNSPLLAKLLKSNKPAAFKPAKGKTWTDKVNDPSKGFKVEKLDKDWSDMSKGDKMLIATPKIVDGYLRQIPPGKEVGMLTMRKDLAIEYGADNSCPLTSGIFLRIASESALEQLNQGKPLKSIAPFWRVVNLKMPLAKKLSCGTAFIEKQRKKEKLG